MILAITTMQDIVSEFVFGWFGGDFTLFAFICLIMIIAFTYMFRFPFQLALVIGWVLVYMFDLLGGGQSYILQITLMLLSLGLAISIIKGVLDYVREWAS